MSQDSQHVQISDEAQAILARLRNVAGVGNAMARAMDRENQLTIGYISARKLSQRGPTTLGVVTNRLRSSIRATQAFFNGREIESAIGSNVKYAGVHEFGIDETVNVKAHRRVGGMGDRFAIGGTSVNRMMALRLGALSSKQAGSQARNSGKYIFRKARAAQTFTAVGTVRAHKRRMKFPARAYIRTSIEARLPQYGDAMSEAVIQFYEGGRA